MDRFAPPHAEGSSHGRTRLIREAYYEHPLYVPLVRRAYELWRDLERETGAPLLARTGSIMVGTRDSGIVTGTLRSAREHGVPHELLDVEDIHRLFPAFTPGEHMVAVHEPGSSLLGPERCISVLHERAESSGATLLPGRHVERWKCCSTGVQVFANGATIHGGALVLCAGAWNRKLALGALEILEIERQVQHWWTPARHPEHFTGGRMPVSMWELADRTIFYTMPDLGDGLKLGWHHNGAVTDPDLVQRSAVEREVRDMEGLMHQFLPDALGERRESTVCLYTNTPDGHFIIDRHPECDRVWIVSACSGHGFKFAPAIGEIVADLITDRAPAFDITPFGLARFGLR